MIKDIGYNESDRIYYTIPGYNLDIGIDEIDDDHGVLRMLKFQKPDVFFDIYIQHIDQHGFSGNNPKVNEAIEDVNKNKKLKKQKSTVVSAKKRQRRIWSAEEETILTNVWYEMNGSGWKVDTGHKSGYLTYIEKEMRKRLQNCDLKADPHIKSKVKILKKQLTYILEIQQYGSGFGWDDEPKMVTGDKDIFMEWAKSRDGAAPLYRKPVIHYDKLVEIYANDLAKGTKVKGLGDQSNMDEDQCNANEVQPESQAADESPQVRGAMNDIKKAFVHGVDVHEQTREKRKQLFEVLCALPGLTPMQVVKATHLIDQDAAKMDSFFSMPDDFQVIFAH
ncbi:hypothetical protein RDABS01_027502 [Bienertia sinuspersici]